MSLDTRRLELLQSCSFYRKNAAVPPYYSYQTTNKGYKNTTTEAPTSREPTQNFATCIAYAPLAFGFYAKALNHV